MITNSISAALVCLFFLQGIKAQELERQVVATAGGGNASGSYTIGEVVVSSNSLEVTAGFQQPSFLGGSTPTGVTDITGELTVYPIPATNVITIAGPVFNAADTEVSLYSNEGKLLPVSAERLSTEMKLNLDNLPTGNYYLNLRNDQDQTFAQLKILKIR